MKPPAEPLPLSAEGEPLTEGSGLPPRTAAGYASLLLLPGGLVFYILDRKDAYVRYYAIQSIVLTLIALVIRGLVVVGKMIFEPIWAIGPVFVWIMEVAFALFFMLWLVVWIVTTISAFRGKKWHLPYLSFILKRLGSRLP